VASAEETKQLVREAFANVRYPGDWCLRGSSEGDEPFLVEEEFKGKDQWQLLEPVFLDQAPAQLGSALSFFSDEAFHFYLPAYLIADIDGLLSKADPLFHLCQGLDDDSKNRKVNPKRYGERTWFDEASHKFSMFDWKEAAAIVAYLSLMRERDPLDHKTVDQALNNYWMGFASRHL
jgi:hypothetical protein